MVDKELFHAQPLAAVHPSIVTAAENVHVLGVKELAEVAEDMLLEFVKLYYSCSLQKCVSTTEISHFVLSNFDSDGERRRGLFSVGLRGR
eukprot:CAMPEP_0170491196 /NCGR_PEP_ID=MMETSP0208-20121228/10576_1 /TAXON_ID=197538 /ORGANISM="Strombidium inclinatum, Strain S3" /LENGTH=89 /DNA_ID=CAMNT_0010766735 /DNA_START=420 /DNA_END=689 /DNA_ORIENTATION=-